AADAAGLTQILAQTGSSLLGMTINLPRSRRLTNEIATASALGESSRIAHLQRQRARIDARFDPARALAATMRYLAIAQRDLGRQDLAVVSYHMGIGNLQNVLHDYNGGQAVPYPQLFFDTAPDNHAGAFTLLQGFGDDSSLYYWRILAAEKIMALYRSNPASLRTLSALQTASADNAEVLHPPGQTRVFATPGDLGAAYSSRQVLPLPSDPAKLGLAYSSALGALADRLGQPVALYRGLRPAALERLIELAARVRTLTALQTARADNAEVLHPPGQTRVFATPGDLGAAYSSRQVLPLPSDPAKLGLAYSPALGALAHRLGQPVALYRGLRPAALDLLIELAARVRTLSHSKAPLIVAQAVTDRDYQHALGAGRGYSLPTTGYQFEIERRYASQAQALAFQAMLDRLQALNLIAWVREPTTIDVTVASDAGRAIVNGL
ncbi:MAG TPA: hypothetical protein VG186_00125, partial [Solirubrobacteraceae bacterium]|nr:hypothetical protein [Solirubrobacteraceae bacterium]